MKKNLILAGTFLFSLVAFSQTNFVNSKWKPQTESPRIKYLEFKKDSLSILFTSGREAEVMNFSQNHDSLVVKKISGTSACAIGVEGWYRIEWLINDEKFLLHKISDDCSGRALGFTSNSFEKIHNENDKN